MDRAGKEVLSIPLAQGLQLSRPVGHTASLTRGGRWDTARGEGAKWHRHRVSWEDAGGRVIPPPGLGH